MELGIPFADISAGARRLRRRAAPVHRARRGGGRDGRGRLRPPPRRDRGDAAAADDGFPERRIIAVFQPHRYTRLRDRGTGLLHRVPRADLVLVCPVYAAGEAPIDGLDQAGIARAVESLAAATEYLAGSVKPGDVVVALGAGNVNVVVRELLEKLA
jgi:UDP-N-acetylmuramate--alanine ligase